MGEDCGGVVYLTFLHRHGGEGGIVERARVIANTPTSCDGKAET